MMIAKQSYMWFYNHIICRYYDLAMKFFYLPFGGETKCRRSLLESVSFRPGERILDMGCGTGSVTIGIASKAGCDCEIVGMDLSSGQIRVADKKRHRRNIAYLLGDASRACFKNGSFDKVFITHALHEMPRVERMDVLAEAKRLLKRNGKAIALEVDNPDNIFVRIFIGLWFFYWLPGNFETRTRREMQRYGLDNEFREAGFVNVGKISKFRRVFQIIDGNKP